MLKGKRIVLVEDSIVRGTTLRHLVRMVREAGAMQVHVRISCPPIIGACYYGIDFQTEEELIASEKTVDQIREHLGVDSLGYLSLEGMLAAAPNGGRQYCTACFTREYPVKVASEVSKTHSGALNAFARPGPSLRLEPFALPGRGKGASTIPVNSPNQTFRREFIRCDAPSSFCTSPC